MARKTYSLSLEESLRERFKQKCKEEDVTMSDVIEMLIDKYLQGDIVLIKEYRLEIKNN